LVLASFYMPLAVVGCGSSEEPLLGRRSEVLAALGTDVMLPSYRTLQTRATALDTAIAARIVDQRPARQTAPRPRRRTGC
jgi:hypothetical protein